jgi:ribosomal protein S27AE
MTEKKKVIDIKPKIFVWCPRCGWGGLMEKAEAYWCDKCTTRWTEEDQQ